MPSQLLNNVILEPLVSWCKDNNIILTNTQIEQFLLYLELILKYQQKTNIVGSNNPECIIRDLFVDSLQILKLPSPPKFPLLDIGTGAGFPSIPLKILFPNDPFILVEPRSRRYAFLRIVEHQLQLQNLEIWNTKLEAIPNNKTWNASISKAFTSPQNWLKLAYSWLNQQKQVYCLFSYNNWIQIAQPWLIQHPHISHQMHIASDRCFALLLP